MELLVAVDGSDAAETALAYATDICDATDGSITVVHAVDPAVYEQRESDPIAGISDADNRLLIENVEDAEARGRDYLERAAEFAAELGHEVDTELLYGDPVVEITAYAADGGFDTVYVGHRGRSERTDLLLGSVAKDVVERATVPVTVTR